MKAANEGLLSRWSRRKLQSKQVNEQEDELLEQAHSLAGELIDNNEISSAQPDPVKNEPLLSDDDMPDIESLNEDSDFSLFMSSGVSDKLRNLALKKMFQAPVFNIRDGLDEYDEDYTSFETLGDIVTCDMKHQMARQAQKKLEAEMEAEAAQSEDKIEPQPDEDTENSLDPTETDITQTDITETDITESSLKHSTTRSQSANNKITGGK